MTYYNGPTDQAHLRNRQNPWFEKQNHIKLAKMDISKRYVNFSSGPVGPVYPPIFLPGDNGIAGDFQSALANGGFYQDSAGTTAASIGDPVGKFVDQSGAGNDLIQSTSTARPILSRHPKSGVRNLLDGSDTYNGGNETVTATPYTISTADAVTITLSGASTAGPLVGPGSLTFTPSAGTLTLAMSAPGATQLELGSTATTYQSRVDEYDVTEAGQTGCIGLTFDGVDDYMVTAANLDMSGSDKVTVNSGVFKGSDATTAEVLHHAYATAHAAEFGILAPNSNGSNTYSLYASFGTARSVSATGYSAPLYTVVTGTADGAEPEYLIRVDGLQQSLGAANLGALVGDDALFYLGARNATSRRFTGTVYGFTVIDRLLITGELDSLEAYQATYTPEVTLP